MEKPKKIDEATLQNLEQAFALGASDLEACFYAKITHKELRDYLKEHPDFADRREILKQRPLLEARQTIVKALKEDPQMALEYLSRSSGR